MRLRLLASAALVAGIAAFTSGCCCPLQCLSLCLGGGPDIPTALSVASAADRAHLDEVPAAVPVAAHARQRY
jgi:hypothetical protein